jgi:hypothetical protein
MAARLPRLLALSTGRSPRRQVCPCRACRVTFTRTDFNVEDFFLRVAACTFDAAVQLEVDREREGNIDITKPPGTADSLVIDVSFTCAVELKKRQSEPPSTCDC